VRLLERTEHLQLLAKSDNPPLSYRDLTISSMTAVRQLEFGQKWILTSWRSRGPVFYQTPNLAQLSFSAAKNALKTKFKILATSGGLFFIPVAILIMIRLKGGHIAYQILENSVAI